MSDSIRLCIFNRCRKKSIFIPDIYEHQYQFFLMFNQAKSELISQQDKILCYSRKILQLSSSIYAGNELKKTKIQSQAFSPSQPPYSSFFRSKTCKKPQKPQTIPVKPYIKPKGKKLERFQCQQNNDFNSIIKLKPFNYFVPSQFYKGFKENLEQRLWNVQIQEGLWPFTPFEDKNNKKYWVKLFEMIQEARCYTLILGNLNDDSWLSTVSHIRFSQLIILNLNHDKITNIETLAFLDCPLLQQLNLVNNRISNTKAFNKLNLRYLKNICIRDNHIQIYQIAKANLHPQMSFNLFQRIFQGQCISIQDITFLMKTPFKSQSASLEFIYHSRALQLNILPQQKIRKQFEHKFQGLQLKEILGTITQRYTNIYNFVIRDKRKINKQKDQWEMKQQEGITQQSKNQSK